jgi:hypothetical protein
MFNTTIQSILIFFKNIKWTPLKISIFINVLLGGALIFLLQSTKIKDNQIITTKLVPINVPSTIGTFALVFNPTPVYVESINNSIVLQKYLNLKDSISKIELVRDVTLEREYKEVYEDSIQKIDVYTKVQGKLLKQSLNYLIKPSIVYAEEKTIINSYLPKNKFLLGVETVLPFNSGYKPTIKTNLLLLNKKNNILSISYDTDKRLWLGYNISF